MTTRTLMISVFAFIMGSILSILVVQYFAPKEGPQSTVPPNPLVVAPDKAAEETK